MKLAKRISALLLALVMALSLSTAAFADDTVDTEYAKPKNSTTVATTPGISSITVNGIATSYVHDDNTGVLSDSPIYARATVSGTEYNLRTATVVITTTSGAPEVYLGEAEITNPTPVGNAYTYQLDMYNKAYEIYVGNCMYVLAAGLTKTTTPISVPTEDPMRITSMTIGGKPATVTMNIVQNPYMGNPYYSMWTSVSYKVKVALDGTPTRSSLASALALPKDASAPAANSCLNTTVTGNEAGTATTCSLNLTSNTILKVNYGTYSRDYYVIATDDGNISVNIGIDFTEVIDSTEYKTNSTVKGKVDTLINQSKIYFGNKGVEATDEALAKLPTHGEITVATGSTVMDVMHSFAVKNSYTNEVPVGCTYMATLNGVGEFTFGTMSGWMYSNNPTWDTETGEALYSTWNTPPVGAADYVLTQGANICWFICCDYTHHSWN